jgi:multisubunit Na+/H+ antiporter MnhG subunit
LICVILVLTNSVGSHATARAIRTRQVGDWKGNSDKRFRFTGEVGKV